MNNLAKSLLIFLLTLIFFFGLSLSFVFAEDQPNQSALSVAPAIIELVLKPGEVKETKISIINVTNFPLPIKGNAKAFISEDILITGTESKEMFDASSWFLLEPSDFILQPRETKEVKVVVITPVGAEPGGHYATIYFQPLLPVEVLSPQTTYLTARVGVLTFLIVKGDINEKASLGDLQTASFRQFGPVEFKIPFKNEGNIHLTPSGEILIKNFRGREVTKLTFSPKIILPQSSKEIETIWDKRFLLGKFTAQAKIVYGSEYKRLERTINFWVIPWLPILMIITLLTLLLTFFILVRRRFILAIKVLLGKAEIGESKK